MAKRKYAVRIYWYHDPDLVSFMINHDLKISRTMAKVVSDFAKGNIYLLDIPPRNDNPMPEYRKSFFKCIILDEEKDKEAIKLLSGIAPGMRNFAIKNILRLYLGRPVPDTFMLENEKMLNKITDDFRSETKLNIVGISKKEKETKTTLESKGQEPTDRKESVISNSFNNMF